MSLLPQTWRGQKPGSTDTESGLPFDACCGAGIWGIKAIDLPGVNARCASQRQGTILCGFGASFGFAAGFLLAQHASGFTN
jgi:hypothetical protein